ncbi:phage protein [Geomicrobium sp. JCM 19037]|uniref:phage portal protein n=1 Tax=Geomicrobium sp. JCM 19037 TaxID=1460634 RepID=UPI00045F3537|nr:phage portal protein [Geomicrobium sp. JCM 19037]GAK03112.1 phage protein [Geomicrobium sp. JCM 19037]
MAFPQENSQWPPPAWQFWFDKFREWGAWYSGDEETLIRYYGNKVTPAIKNTFWQNQAVEKRSNSVKVHLPIAGDIASTSANLLFGEVPDIQYDEDAGGGDRIKQFLEDNAFYNLILEGAEMSAGLSGLFFKLDIDPELMDVPVVSAITPIQALPEFTRGMLTAVTFYQVVRREQSGKTYRLFEDRRRENGQLVIRYRLYDGSHDRIGLPMDLNQLEETAGMDLEDISYNMEGLGCVYIPNMRPNRLQPGNALGVSDYQGALSLMSSLDETWSSLMRDIRLGLGRVLVDEELVDENDSFDVFNEVFLKLKMGDLRVGSDSYDPIKEVQFDIRVDEHLRTVEELCGQIASRAGYNPQTLGFNIQGQAESGTALHIRERKSLLTREKKSRYWQPALRQLLTQMQQMDIESSLSTRYTPQTVYVSMQDGVVPNEREESETIRNLDQAKAISTLMKVRKQHPDWEEKEVLEEVERIRNENGSEGMPFPGLP